jgi:hypothetical protein
MRIVAVDPGVTTGYAFCELKNGSNPPTVLECGDMRGLSVVSKILSFGADFYILENFMLRPDMARIVSLNDPDLVTVQVLGALKYALQSDEIKIQHPFQKSQITDNLLKKYGLYALHKSRHTRDAFRHIIYFWLKGM